MTIVQESLRRRRRQPDELRAEAIAAARDILLADGPAAITLQAVAAALGMTHGSITHHFNAAANLQAAVADTLMEQLLSGVRVGVCALKDGDIDEAGLVNLVFDLFEDTGVGKLIGFLAASDSPLLYPLFDKFARLPHAIATDQLAGSAFTETELPTIIESVVTSALGASLIGANLLQALGLDPSSARQRVAFDLTAQRAMRRAASKGAPDRLHTLSSVGDRWSPSSLPFGVARCP